MRMIDEAGNVVYYNLVKKRGKLRWIIKAASGQTLKGRDGQRLKSRSFAQEHQARAFLARNGYGMDKNW